MIIKKALDRADDCPLCAAEICGVERCDSCGEAEETIEKISLNPEFRFIMGTFLTKSDMDASTVLHSGKMSAYDLNYVRHCEKRRMRDGTVFEAVAFKRKKGVSESEPLPPDYVRFIPDEELEAEYAPFRNSVPNVRKYGDCSPRYCGMCSRADCRHNG